MKAQREIFSEAFPEWIWLVRNAWQELCEYQAEFPMDLDLEAYLRLQEMGKLYLATIRQDGILVGYFLALLGGTLHYRNCLTAQMDMIYIDPRFRSGAAALRLLRFVLSDLRALGIQRVNAGTKTKKDIGRLFRTFGFQPVEITYSRLLEA